MRSRDDQPDTLLNDPDDSRGVRDGEALCDARFMGRPRKETALEISLRRR